MTGAHRDEVPAPSGRSMHDDEGFVFDAPARSRRGVRFRDGRERASRLRVREYAFEGEPRGSLERLAHPSLPGILSLDADDDGGPTRIVAVLPAPYAPLGAPGARPAPGGPRVGLTAVASAAAALASAHACGAIHGDLGPHRVWTGPAGDVLVEGVGVPWQARETGGSAAEEDLRALSATLVAFGDALPAPVRDLLRAAASGRAGAPCDAHALTRSLEPFVERLAAPEAARPVPAEPADAPAQAPAPVRASPEDGASVPPAREPRSESSRVVKDLPPGAVYRTGEIPGDEDPPPGRPPTPGPARPELERPRPPWTLLALLAISAGVATLASLPRDPAPEPVTVPGGGYVVRVEVAPESGPPLQIVVVDAPHGSELAPATRLGTAPRRIVVDRAGRWVLRGVFGQARGPDAEFLVPRDDPVVLTLRPGAP